LKSATRDSACRYEGLPMRTLFKRGRRGPVEFQRHGEIPGSRRVSAGIFAGGRVSRKRARRTGMPERAREGCKGRPPPLACCSSYARAAETRNAAPVRRVQAADLVALLPPPPTPHPGALPRWRSSSPHTKPRRAESGQGGPRNTRHRGVQKRRMAQDPARGGRLAPFAQGVCARRCMRAR